MGVNYIISDPKIMMGKPVIKGTRITVELILEKLSQGQTVADLIKSYPHITEEQIYSAFRFASEALKADAIYPIAS